MSDAVRPGTIGTVRVIVQAGLVLAVWAGVVAWLDLPASLWLAGVPFAIFYAWRDHRPDPNRRLAYEFEDEPFEGHEPERDGIVWL